MACGRKRTALVPGSIAINVDLHKIFFSSERWVGPKVTSCMPPVGKGGPLVVIDRKPSLWLPVLWNVGANVAILARFCAYGGSQNAPMAVNIVTAQELR